MILATKKLDLFKVSHIKTQNFGFLSVACLSVMGCNASRDESCYGALGLIAGSICANADNSTKTRLEKIYDSGTFKLTNEIDTVNFINANDVIASQYSLTAGDILKNPSTVSLELINAGSNFEGQTIYEAEEISIKSTGSNVVLASNWFNNEKITILQADQDLVLNDLQATQLNSAIAPDNYAYPGVLYLLDGVVAPEAILSLNFDPDALNGTSTLLNIEVSDSNISISSSVYNPTTAAPAAAPATTNPYDIASDTNLEDLTLIVSDTERSNGTILPSLSIVGLKNLKIEGGKLEKEFEISSPLNSSLVNLDASAMKSNLILDMSDSVLKKNVKLGLGADTLFVGNALAEDPSFDNFFGGLGTDKIVFRLSEDKKFVPNLDSFEIMDISFDAAAIFDFGNSENLNEINVYESSAGVSFENVPHDLDKFSVQGTQTGDWEIAYTANADASPIINWTNNTGAPVILTEVSFDEISSFSLLSDGSDSINLSSLILDSNDTTALNFSNTNDGDLVIASGVNINSADAIKMMNINTSAGGAIKIGSAADSFGIDDASKLSTLVLRASETGVIEVGDLGSTTALEDLHTMVVESKGADILIGKIQAQSVGNFSFSLAKSTNFSSGNFDFSSPGSSFTVSGSGSIGSLNFLNEAFDKIDFTDLVTDTAVNFSNADSSVEILGGAGADSFTLGKGTDKVSGNSGSDVFILGNGKTGITSDTADSILDFQTGVDKLKLGLAGDKTLNTGNYIEAINPVVDFESAVSSANIALAGLNSTSTATELYSFQFDSNDGYLFIDTDSDGAAEDVIFLANIESSEIAASDIIV